MRPPIAALDAHSITIHDEITSGLRSCNLGPGSPATRTYRAGEQVQAFCARGKLTGINRS